jgi:hypothetical protein
MELDEMNEESSIMNIPGVNPMMKKEQGEKEEIGERKRSPGRKKR